MRLLFTCVAGSQQHLQCLLPLARAAQARGDDVALASGADRRHVVERLGFPFHPVGLDFARQVRWARILLPSFRLGGADEELEAYGSFFAGLAGPAAVSELVDLVAAFGPDVVVHEAAELGAPLAASRCGVPYVTHGWGLPLPRRYVRAAARRLAPVWTDHGLPPHPWGGLYEHGYIDPCPPSLWTIEPAVPRGALQRSRPAAAMMDDRDIEWLDRLPTRPTVHVTLGTAGFNRALRVFRDVLAGLADVDVNVIVTVGPDNDPGELGELAPNATAVPFIAHATLVPRCRLVVCHGGTGSVLSALEHGVPLLVVPQGGDQFRMADAVVRSGAGLALNPGWSVADVRGAVRRLLEGGSFTVAARRIATEIEGMPPSDEVLAWLSSAVVGGSHAPAN